MRWVNATTDPGRLRIRRRPRPVGCGAPSRRSAEAAATSTAETVCGLLRDWDNEMAARMNATSEEITDADDPETANQMLLAGWDDLLVLAGDHVDEAESLGLPRDPGAGRAWSRTFAPAPRRAITELEDERDHDRGPRPHRDRGPEGRARRRVHRGGEGQGQSSNPGSARYRPGRGTGPRRQRRLRARRPTCLGRRRAGACRAGARASTAARRSPRRCSRAPWSRLAAVGPVGDQHVALGPVHLEGAGRQPGEGDRARRSCRCPSAAGRGRRRRTRGAAASAGSIRPRRGPRR